jgi:alpha-L-fucosidase
VRSSLPLPIKTGDIATFLGKDGESKPLKWRWTEEGVFELRGPLKQMKLVENAWAFKITYQ